MGRRGSSPRPSPCSLVRSVRYHSSARAELVPQPSITNKNDLATARSSGRKRARSSSRPKPFLTPRQESPTTPSGWRSGYFAFACSLLNHHSRGARRTKSSSPSPARGAALATGATVASRNLTCLVTSRSCRATISDRHSCKAEEQLAAAIVRFQSPGKYLSLSSKLRPTYGATPYVVASRNDLVSERVCSA